MSLLYRGPSGLPRLASHVAINSFFRVHESVANKEEKRSWCQDSISSPALFPQQEKRIPESKWTMWTQMLKTDALEMSAHGSRHHGGGRWWQLTSQPWNLPAGLSDTVQPPKDWRHTQRRNKRSLGAMEKGAERGADRTNKTREERKRGGDQSP